ncbi:MAG: M15 family metallopeptidase [Cyanobacteriota bacterium]|jgi:D-alanyl-D-alanine dipeptidase
MAAQRPWHPIPIHDNGEALLELPPELLRLEPHPYAALGAPYGPQATPFRLRSGVLQRLLEAQALLEHRAPGVRLAIFDAWRPLAVQRFMVRHAIETECRVRGLDPSTPSAALDDVEALVGRFWAPPSADPHTPPPHSTGAAVDLTLAARERALLPMGGAIDELGPVSEPDHYAAACREDPASAQAQWHQNRSLLAAVMGEAGFARHPNEWWHFSHGDQLWAWQQQQDCAHYGRAPEDGTA